VDDLILVVLGAMAAAVAIAVAIMVATAILAATAIGASVWALAEGVGAFSSNFVGSIRERGGARRAPRDPEPAFELYVLGQMLVDFRFALGHAAGVLTDVRKKLGGYAAKWSEGVTIPLAIGAVVGGYLGTAVAGIVGVLTGVCIGLVVALAYGVSWILIWALRVADLARRRIRHASYECPMDHERFSLPVYVCPFCGAEHKRLVPGRWGILKRECRCGKTALPTAVINGRQRVPQRCPSGHPMSGFLGFAENLPIAIVGGPSSGKSTFLAGALIELDDPQVGVSLEPLNESKEAYSQLVEAMRAGVPPKKTTNERAPALVAEVQGSGRSRALYAYDVAGEVYGAEDKVRGLQFLARSAGIVILIDPFSIPRVAADHADELRSLAQHILPSSEDPTRVFERLLATVKESGANLANMPLAVILAKADACGIDREIEAFAQTVSTDQAPRAWLEANGAGNLVRAIQGEFKQVSWFSASALGRMPAPGDSSPFVPRGALAPLLWILERRNVRIAEGGVTATHKARGLTGTAADFPPPTASARAWRAAAVAIGAGGTLVAIVVILAALAGSNGTTASASGNTNPGAVAEEGKGSGAPGPTAPATQNKAGSEKTNSAPSTAPSRKDTLPAVSRGQMRSEIQHLLYEFHADVVSHHDRDAWNLLTQRKRRQSQREHGYGGWAHNQNTLNPYLEPAGIKVSIISTEPRSGVATVNVTGMKWNKPGAACTQWSGITWVRYEGGAWHYDPGYSTTSQRQRRWKSRYSELLGGRC
jgi:Double-GTPase 2